MQIELEIRCHASIAQVLLGNRKAVLGHGPTAAFWAKQFFFGPRKNKI
jgi:hypothetical protein